MIICICGVNSISQAKDGLVYSHSRLKLEALVILLPKEVKRNRGLATRGITRPLAKVTSKRNGFTFS